jgi:hypothetical protein
MSDDNPLDEAYLEYLRWHREVRAQHSAYYEKLALLDGGTIALATTVVLGSSHGQLKHKWSLALGLGLLAIAMVSLLIRNFAESRRETLMTHQQYYDLIGGTELSAQVQPHITYFDRYTTTSAKLGIFCTFIGITLLAAVLILSII